ncbi:hypothetical protein [Celerinatantimonas sp. MCCC 1A17872]|uniref:hypothetical protein n=1 Tax=Celerinatantimonas sp. MCCC 1A17872 TaxID=3177514 RepID=UPI0038C76C58
MHKFEITPHLGIGPIKLGMTRAEVNTCFGKPEFSGNGRVGYLSGFMIDFDENDKVEFIELAKSNKFAAFYKGINLHSVTAKQAVACVENDDEYDKESPEQGYSYIFKKLQLSLWRGTIAQMDDNDDAPNGVSFEAIGIAVDGYF